MTCFRDRRIKRWSGSHDGVRSRSRSCHLAFVELVPAGEFEGSWPREAKYKEAWLLRYGLLPAPAAVYARHRFSAVTTNAVTTNIRTAVRIAGILSGFRSSPSDIFAVCWLGLGGPAASCRSSRRVGDARAASTRRLFEQEVSRASPQGDGRRQRRADREGSAVCGVE